MKTIYTLLLACGLCFTSHAQDLQVLSDNITALSSAEKSEINSLSFGSIHSLFFSDTVLNMYDDGTPIKKVEISSIQGVALLNSYSSSLDGVELLELKWQVNDVYNFSNQLYQKLPNLKYIYVKSYELLNQSKVQSIIANLQGQFPDVIVVYETLQDS